MRQNLLTNCWRCVCEWESKHHFFIGWPLYYILHSIPITFFARPQMFAFAGNSSSKGVWLTGDFITKHINGDLRAKKGCCFLSHTHITWWGKYNYYRGSNLFHWEAGFSSVVIILKLGSNWSLEYHMVWLYWSSVSTRVITILFWILCLNFVGSSDIHKVYVKQIGPFYPYERRPAGSGSHSVALHKVINLWQPYDVVTLTILVLVTGRSKATTAPCIECIMIRNTTVTHLRGGAANSIIYKKVTFLTN